MNNKYFFQKWDGNIILKKVFMSKETKNTENVALNYGRDYFIGGEEWIECISYYFSHNFHKNIVWE